MRNNAVSTTNNRQTISNTNRSKYAPVWELSLWELCSHIKSCMPDTAPILQRNNVSWGKNADILYVSLETSAIKLRGSVASGAPSRTAIKWKFATNFHTNLIISVSKVFVWSFWQQELWTVESQCNFFNRKHATFPSNFFNAGTYVLIMLINFRCTLYKAMRFRMC